MSNPEIIYRKLPGQALTIKLTSSGDSTLWLGPDHLLWVREQGYSEEYKRFYFPDIQAFVIRRTTRRQAINLTLAVIVLLIFAWTIQLGGWSAAPIGGFICSPFILFVVINSLLGPGCSFHIRTAVQTERVSSIVRINSAEEIVRQLTPRIESAQGEVSAEELSGLEFRAPIQQAPANPQIPVKPAGSLAIPYLFYSTMIANGLRRGLLHFGHARIFGIVNSLIFLAAIILAIVTLVSLHASSRDRNLKTLAWVSATYLGIYAMVGYVYTIVWAVSNPTRANDPWAQFQFSAEDSYPLAITIINAVFSTILGISGLLQLVSLRPAAAETESMSPPSIPPSVRASEQTIPPPREAVPPPLPFEPSSPPAEDKLEV